MTRFTRFAFAPLKMRLASLGAVLKKNLEDEQNSFLEMERSLKAENGGLQSKLASLKREMEVSSQEHAGRINDVESAREAAEWERKRALERATGLEAARVREMERATRAESAATEATENHAALKREAIIAKESNEKTLSELRISRSGLEEEINTLKKELEKAREEKHEEITEASFRLEAVKSEVARRVPELAANALEKAEGEWKKRLNLEIEKVVSERDSYIGEAQSTVSNLQGKLNEFHNKELEVQSQMMKLNAENRNLEQEIDSLRQESVMLQSQSENQSQTGNINTNRKKQQFMPPQPPPFTPGLNSNNNQTQTQNQNFNNYAQSIERIAQSVTFTALQGQLGLMQAQCKMLLGEGGEDSNSNNNTRASDLKDVSNIYRHQHHQELFDSPQPKLRSSNMTHTTNASVILDAEISKNYSTVMGLDENGEDLQDLSYLSRNEMDLTDGGFHGGLWKSRYS